MSVKKVLFNDLTGMVSVESSDGSTNKFNIADTVTATTSPGGGVELSQSTLDAAQVGMIRWSAHRPKNCLPATGEVYLQSDYPRLFARIGRFSNSVAWSAITVPTNAWRAVAYSPKLDLHVAVASSGSGNRVMKSTDGGATWTAVSGVPDQEWYCVIWSERLELFVATSITGSGSRVMTSADADLWELQATPADNSWMSVCDAPGIDLLIAVSSTGTGKRVMTSSDGKVWELQTTPADIAYRSVCWSGRLGMAVAVASGGVGKRVMTSPDGKVWTQQIGRASCRERV